MAFTLNSPAFRNGEKIAAKYTADGENLSPPLAWNGAPAGALSFVLIMSAKSHVRGKIALEIAA